MTKKRKVKRIVGDKDTVDPLDPAVPEKPPPADTRSKDIEKAVAGSSAANRQKKIRNTRLKMGGAVAAVCMIVLMVYTAMLPRKGSVAYGICRIFLENYIQYPPTLRLSEVEEFGDSVRIWHTHTDAFGEYKYDYIQCFLKADDNLPFVLSKVTINRREIDSRVIARFNKTLPALFTGPLDLTLPEPMPDMLEGVEFDTQKFRKPIL